MLQKRIHGSKRIWIYSVLVLGVAAFGLAYSFRPAIAQRSTVRPPESPAATFTNSAAITIPAQGNGSPYPSAIAVSGLSGTIPATPGSISVTINNLSHTFPDDFGIVLVGPNGDALLLMDGVTEGEPASGVTFTLSDAGTMQMPDVAITPGTYKPTAYFTGSSFPAPGPLLAYGHPGPAGANTATFASIFGGDAPNGTWNLFVRDFVSGDSGSIAGGWTLTINTGPASPVQHVFDTDGDGRTDYGVVRNTGGGPSGQLTWLILDGIAARSTSQDSPEAVKGVAWGIASDAWVPEDYDGDGKTDIAVWRGGAPFNSHFYIINSQTNTVDVITFGQSGDDPSVVGDYDGDNKADIAIYRDGTGGGPSNWWFRRSMVGGPGCTAANCTVVQWGQDGDFPGPGDYDGDGRNDFVVQRSAGGGVANFWIRFATGTTSNSNPFGTPTDAIVPGDYDGDGKTDLAVARDVGGVINWFYRPSTGGSDAKYVLWGASATDFPVQGDYDGDGKTDQAVWRPGVGFLVRKSSGGTFGIPWGQVGDRAVADFNTH